MTARRHAALHSYRHIPHTRRSVTSVIKLVLIVACLMSVSGIPTALAAGDTEVFIPVVSTRPAPTAKTVQQGMFVTWPRDTSVQTVAAKASFMVLPRTEARYRDTMRSHGYSGKVVQYFLANEVNGPGPYANASAWCDANYVPHINQVAHLKGDFCKYVHPNESWFLHNASGKRLYSWSQGRVMYHMNPASSGWRAFAAQRMVRDVFGDSSQAKLGFDGVFLDNLASKTYKLRYQIDNSDGTVKEYGTDAAYRDAMRGYLSTISGALRPGSLVWANMIDDYGVSQADYMSYVQYLDGWLNEAWAVDWFNKYLSVEHWNTHLNIAEATLAAGKGALTNVQGTRWDYNRQQFGLASYLLITNNSKAYFRYAEAAKYEAEWWQYDNYNLVLGAPLGKRYQSGSSWRRDFECGYVTVDPAARTSKIVQGSCGSAPAPTPAPSATPAPSSAPRTGQIALPGVFQAEDYKSGGRNVGFSDSTSGNSGGQYRWDDVDIEKCYDGSNCHDVGWITSGEWLAYDVNVATSGNYTFGVRVASPNSGKRFRIEIDGVNVSGSMSVPQTGGWQSWNHVWTKWIYVSAGSHTVRIVAETDGFNLNSIEAWRQ